MTYIGVSHLKKVYKTQEGLTNEALKILRSQFKKGNLLLLWVNLAQGSQLSLIS